MMPSDVRMGHMLTLFQHMKRPTRSSLVILIIAVWLSAGLLAHGQEDPTTAVKEMVDEVISILKNEELEGPEQTQERRRLLEAAVERRLDYEEMAKRTLALHWRKRTPSEQKEFVPIFHAFLSKTYAKRLETYTNEAVQYGDVRMKDSFAEVQTTVTSSKTELQLDYRLKRQDSRWRIYDIVINGVSLVKNYRDQFNRVINKSSYAELVSKLQDRTEEIATP